MWRFPAPGWYGLHCKGWTGHRGSANSASDVSTAACDDVRVHPQPSHSEAEEACDRDQAEAWLRHAARLAARGHDVEALRWYGRALGAFRRSGQWLWQARVLNDRGVLQADRGDLRQARRDLRRAERLYGLLGRDADLARVEHNLGFVAARAADVPGALLWYERADDYFRQHGWPAEALIDRAELLLLARLWSEARQVAEAASQAAGTAGRPWLVMQARLVQARAAFGAGDGPDARATAEVVGAALRGFGLIRESLLADFVVWRANPVPGRARELAERLAAAAWPEYALETLIVAAEAVIDPVGDGRASTGNDATAPGPASSGGDAIRAGQAAMADLARAVAVVPPGPARLWSLVWYGRALVRLHAGDRAGAKQALASSAQVTDAHREKFAAVELRANVDAEASHTARLGLRLAIADGRPLAVLTWSERRRAAMLPPARPAVPSPEVSARLAELRQLHAEMSASRGDADTLTRLRQRQRALEEAVRRLTWRTPAAGPDRRQSVTRLLSDLDGHAVVVLVRLDDVLLAVTVVDGCATLSHLGSAAEAAAEARSLRFGQRRLALRQGTASALAAARAAVRHAAARLETLVFQPIRRLVADRPLVLVPTVDLYGVAWPLLPTCRGRPLYVAPSLALWHAARHHRRPSVNGREQPGEAASGHVGADPRGHALVLVASPTPRHATTEVLRIGRDRPGTTVLAGAAARVPDVLLALDGAAVGHVAAHGRFRADSPLFSTLWLADGPLTVHDLAHLRRPPDLLVLSACDTGRAGAAGGDGVLGFSSSMLGVGTRAVVASVGPVDDEATAALMVDLHRRLWAGTNPAAALAEAQLATADDLYASTYGFVCFGAA